MERDFKWLAAILSSKCVLCFSEIRQGAFFYYEAVERKHYCRDCGRAIHKLGYEKGVKARSVAALFPGASEFFK